MGRHVSRECSSERRRLGFGAVGVGGQNSDDALFFVVAGSLKDLQWRHDLVLCCWVFLSVSRRATTATGSGRKKETAEGAELQRREAGEVKKKKKNLRK